MILHVYTMTWNEEYMIEYFLRHYEGVADKIFVIDDQSTDRTREIVRAHPKAEIIGYPLEPGLVEPAKAKLFSRVYRGISRGVADWAIVVDSDEFIFHPNLRGVLEEQKALGNHIIKPDKGWMLGARTTPQTTGQLYESCTLGFEKRSYAKPVIFDAAIDVWFALGQHSVRSKGARMVSGTGTHLLHCCYLSWEWILDHLHRRWARMPQHELDRIAAGGLTLELAIERARRAYHSMRPWSLQCVCS